MILVGEKMNRIKETFYSTKKKIEKNVEKAGELLQLKTKLKENDLEIKNTYRKIGEQYYNKHFENPLAELQELTNQITVDKKEEKRLMERKNALNKLKICKHCGSANSKDGQYCTNCGKSLQDVILVCDSCGKIIKNSMKFCPKCGNKLSKTLNDDCPRDL